MVNFGLLTAEIRWRVWGTRANFNGFRVLAALLHGTLVVGVSQTAALNRGRHLYSTGRPSRWALAHILVLFYSSPNLSGRRLNVYHTSIHMVWPYIANLECRSEMCCTRLAGNAGPKYRQKFAIWATSHNLSGYIFVTKARRPIDNQKKLAKQ